MVRIRAAQRTRDPAPSTGLVQLDFGAMLERMSQRDASAPALALFAVVLALLGFGFILQAGHAATTLTPVEFKADLLVELRDRGLALIALLLAARIGLDPLRRGLPVAMTVSLIGLLLVWMPGVGSAVNGSRRWIDVGLSVQPSEFARIALIIWIAWYCGRLGSRMHDLRRGVLRMFMPTLLFCGLVWMQPDKGGALVMFACACATMWIGGVDASKVALPFFMLVAGALVVAATADSYSRGRLDMWLGQVQNEQVAEGMAALAGGGALGTGFAQGELRNRGVSYMDSDFVFSLVGEEFGAFGLVLVMALFAALFWFSFRMVLSIRGRFEAVAAFGLCISIAVQALVHMGSVSGLFPPKGMTLPFLSDGGTSGMVSSLAIGLAIGAARRSTRHADSARLPCSPSNATV